MLKPTDREENMQPGGSEAPANLIAKKRIQTAEGWKRKQIKMRKSSKIIGKS